MQPRSSFQAVRRRHADYYLRTLRQLDELYRAGGASFQTSLERLDADWDDYLAAWRWASTGYANNPQQARICADFPHAGTRCLHHRLSPREFITWLETALHAAKIIHDRDLQGFHLGNLGIYYWRVGDYTSAIRCYEEALVIDREVGNRTGEAADYGNLGLVVSDMGNSDRAIECYQMQLRISRELGDSWNECAALGNLGVEYYQMGNYELAAAYNQQDLDICRRIGNRVGEAHSLDNFGRVDLANGDARSATNYFEQSLCIMREIGDEAGEAEVCWHLGQSHITLGQFTQGIAYMWRRVNYERSIRHADADRHATELAQLVTLCNRLQLI